MILASGGGQPNISQDVVRSLRIPAPEVENQLRVISALDELNVAADDSVAALDRSRTLLTEYRQSLITAAVTGELDVTTAGSGIPG